MSEWGSEVHVTGNDLFEVYRDAADGDAEAAGLAARLDALEVKTERLRVEREELHALVKEKVASS